VTRRPAYCLAAATLALGSAVAWPAEPRHERVIRWSGRDWIVKDEPVAVGPGPNPFSAHGSDVRVDAQGRLHLRIVRRHGRWYSSEIASRESLGYGTYHFDVAAGATVIPGNAILGLFTYAMAPEQEHREIDIELSHWGDGRHDNGQCAIQPAAPDDLLHRFPVEEYGGGWSMQFTWAPSAIDCSVVSSGGGAGAATVIGEHRFARAVPAPGEEKVRLNLWLFHGSAPDTGRGAEVVVNSFRFTPLPR